MIRIFFFSLFILESFLDFNVLSKLDLIRGHEFKPSLHIINGTFDLWFYGKKFNFIHHFRICLIMGYHNGWSWYLISYLFVGYESRFCLSLFIEYRSKILSIYICWIWIQILFVSLFSIVLYLLILLLWTYIFSILTEFHSISMSELVCINSFLK